MKEEGGGEKGDGGTRERRWEDGVWGIMETDQWNCEFKLWYFMW